MESESEVLGHITDGELVRIAYQAGIEKMVILDCDGGLFNRDEIVAELYVADFI
jgi:uncharacterized protein YhaN